jgi:hypothetical protein
VTAAHGVEVALPTLAVPRLSALAGDLLDRLPGAGRDGCGLVLSAARHELRDLRRVVGLDRLAVRQDEVSHSASNAAGRQRKVSWE